MIPLYSIIIPHKNIPKLLQRCLDSIPQRDDLEVIVVDDDSNAEIVDFENFPGKERKDTTIFFDKSGKGAGRARNIGLQHAKGKKILFADADDFYNYCIKEVLDEYKDDDSDIVFFNVLGVDSNSYTSVTRGSSINRHHLLNEKNHEDAVFQFKFDVGVPWTKLFNKDFIDSHSLCFDETRIHNDTTFSYMAGFFAKKVKIDKRALYCITYRSDSVSYNLDEDRILTRMDVLSRRDRFYLDNDIDLNKIEVNYHIDYLASFLQNGQKELYDKCIKILVRNGLKISDINKRIKKTIKTKKINHRKRKLIYLIEKYILKL